MLGKGYRGFEIFFGRDFLREYFACEDHVKNSINVDTLMFDETCPTLQKITRSTRSRSCINFNNFDAVSPDSSNGTTLVRGKIKPRYSEISSSVVFKPKHHEFDPLLKAKGKKSISSACKMNREHGPINGRIISVRKASGNKA